jgi:hypothetical protein
MYLRSGLALLCAASLSACGGGGGSLALQASISGLTKTGLILTNNKDTVTVDAGTAVIQFPTLVAQDEQFNIQIKQQPTGAICTASANQNKANVYTVQQPLISCITNSAQLGGNVTGLKGVGLVLANGSDTVSVTPSANPADKVHFVLPVAVGDGAPYGVTILAQPTGGTSVCKVTSLPGNFPAVPTLPANSPVPVYDLVTVVCN